MIAGPDGIDTNVRPQMILQDPVTVDLRKLRVFSWPNDGSYGLTTPVANEIKEVRGHAAHMTNWFPEPIHVFAPAASCTTSPGATQDVPPPGGSGWVPCGRQSPACPAGAVGERRHVAQHSRRPAAAGRGVRCRPHVTTHGQRQTDVVLLCADRWPTEISDIAGVKSLGEILKEVVKIAVGASYHNLDAMLVLLGAWFEKNRTSPKEKYGQIA